ncbi:NAD-dependent protein deacylase [Bacillus lacus]|uniref:protein acetyllysine N-acetyltransferase n=1 Tax=Metabacillus lacus TaxID=1983721 RepID=A0A7X2IYK2_9BACI|nr:NAD-dependent protein deacylase [Metabacillus lacus]MRX71518.1 NAD-dependent protein deacylase [Metabacillus lacus]
MLKEKSIEELILNARKISVLTGAGISTDSGIADFRSTAGIWTEDLSRMDVISRPFFESQPETFWQHYKDIFQTKLSSDYQPNRGHAFLKELEDQGKDIHIFTQNVDGLHTKAGSSNVYELHGTVQTATCPECEKKYSLEFVNRFEVPACEGEKSEGVPCEAVLKPDVVLFGDVVHHFSEMYTHVNESDLFLVMGTSLEVYPVNQVVKDFQFRTDMIKVLVNKEPTKMDYLFDYTFHSPIGELVEKLKS